MGYALKNYGSRCCVRCGKDLTDAASMNEGIGPVCRKLDNKLLATCIPADIQAARGAFALLDMSNVDPASSNCLNNVAEALFEGAAAKRTDWRVEVKRLEWVLSFPLNVRYAQVALTQVVRALGYVGLAALWEGKASTGEATVTFANDRLHVVGPRNADFRAAIKRVYGWRFHGAANGMQPSWSLPVAQADQFALLVQTYYPNHDASLLAQAVKEAQDAHALAQAQVAPPVAQEASHVALKVPNMNKVRIVPNGMEWVNVFSPFNASFVSELKFVLPSKMRRWNPVEKCWEVHASCMASLSDIVAKHYNESVGLPKEETVPQAQESYSYTAAPEGSLPF
jgi:hypothetical protein